VEGNGCGVLYPDGEPWQSHGTFSARNSLLGPTYLILGEVFGPADPITDMILKANQFPGNLDNAGLSQPYYVRHDYAHIHRGDVKAYLKMYYNQMTGLSDGETYTFWEHYHTGGQHKTHEEGWFLMQTRWMLYLEEERTLKLFPGIPRAWLEPGKKISVKNAASYFGRISFHAESSADDAAQISVEIKFHDAERRPDNLVVRIPHPRGLHAVRCSAGTYSATTETVTLDNVENGFTITLSY